MPTLLFVCPAQGRFSLSRICLRQLRRTCDALCQEGIEASTIVVSDDENLDTARELGFGIYERDNRFLSRRFNDGMQGSLDEVFNARPADYVVPVGSDDWVDHRILLELPGPNTVIGFQRMCFVREDGREMVARHLNYRGGAGVRIYPREVLRGLRFRPADEDRRRGCDTSILTNLMRAESDLRIVHRDIDPRQLVDWKSPGEQLNSYAEVAIHRSESVSDPFEALADIYPADSLAAMQHHYGLVPALA